MTRDWVDYVMLLGTITGVIILIYYTRYTKHLKDLTSSALEHAKASSTSALEQARKSTEVALAQTRESNEHTAESNRIARQTLEYGYRAWLVLAKFDRQSPQLLAMTIKNTGGMPATGIGMNTNCRLHIDDEIRDIPTQSDVVQCIGNGEAVPIAIDIEITDDDLGKIIDGGAMLEVEIKIVYYDAFCISTQGVTGRRGTKFKSFWLGGNWSIIEIYVT